MDIKVHYLITLCALFFLGILIINPALKAGSQNESESRINKNTEVQYNLN